VARRSNIAKDRGTYVTNKSDAPMFAIERRPATLGTNINTFRVKKGTASVPFVSFRVLGINLTDEEVDEIQPHFSSAFFDTKGKQRLVAFPQLEPQKFVDTFEGATVRLVPGLDSNGKTLELTECAIKGLVFEPQPGGGTWLSLTIVAEKVKGFDRMDDRLDGQIYIEIVDAALAEKDARERQQGLPLGTTSDAPPKAAH
jgi:hypothetical protein